MKLAVKFVLLYLGFAFCVFGLAVGGAYVFMCGDAFGPFRWMFTFGVAALLIATALELFGHIEDILSEVPCDVSDL